MTVTVQHNTFYAANNTYYYQVLMDITTDITLLLLVFSRVTITQSGSVFSSLTFRFNHTLIFR